MGTFFRSLTFVVILASSISIVDSASADTERSSPERIGTKRFALIYLHSDESTKSFASLLEANGHRVDRVQLDDVPEADFAADSAVIVAPDIERAWSKAAAEKIKNARKPVVGVGEGGYYFFGKLKLSIGSPWGWHGDEVAVRATQNGNSVFWSTFKPQLSEDGELVLYAKSGNVGIHLPDPQAGVVPLGQELSSSSHFALVEQNRRYILWGFGGSPLDMTELGKQLFVHTCEYAAQAEDLSNRGSRTQSAADVAAQPQVESARVASKKQAATRRAGERFAYIYLNDEAAAKCFADLLRENGQTVELVKLENIATADFASFAAVVVGSDIGKAWSAAAAKKLSAAKKPVLGIGEGGAMYFEKIGLAIGWMQGWLGGEVGLKAIERGDSEFWSSVDFPIPEDGELILYSKSGQIGIYAPDPTKGVVALGREIGDRSHYPLIQQDRRYVLWGFYGSPKDMTKLGKQMFVHTCSYVARAGKEANSSTMAVAAGREPVAEGALAESSQGLSDRVRALESRVADLEQTRRESRPTRALPAEELIRSIPAAASHLGGTWLNIAGREDGFPKLEIVAEGKRWSIRGWGACEPTDCDWGSTDLDLLGDSISSTTFSDGFATWDHGFKTTHIAVHLDNDQLIAELFGVYKDNSGRSNTRKVYRFKRAEAKSEGTKQ